MPDYYFLIFNQINYNFAACHGISRATFIVVESAKFCVLYKKLR